MIAVKVHKPQLQVLLMLLYLTVICKFSSLDSSVTGALGTVEVKKREAEIDIASFKAERLQDSLMREQEKYRVSFSLYQILICVNNKLFNNFKICCVCVRMMRQIVIIAWYSHLTYSYALVCLWLCHSIGVHCDFEIQMESEFQNLVVSSLLYVTSCKPRVIVTLICHWRDWIDSIPDK